MAIQPGTENHDNSPWYDSLEKIALNWNDALEKRAAETTGDYNAWHVKFEAKITRSDGIQIDLDGLKELRNTATGLTPMNSRYVWITEIKMNLLPPPSYELHVRRKLWWHWFWMHKYSKCEFVKSKRCFVKTTHPKRWSKISDRFQSFLPLTTYLHWDENGFRAKLFTLPQTPEEIEELLQFLENLRAD